MRKLAVLAILTLSFISCGKNDSGCQPNSVDSEKGQLMGYATTNNITYTTHSSGFLYQIIDSGMGASPISTSLVKVNYVGKRFNNAVFDSSIAPYSNSLSNLIDGWKLGLPLIKKGGHIKLIIPSALAYSCVGSKRNDVYIIQPNEPIFFDITLLDVQ